MTVTAAAHVATLTDCATLTPALCYGVRQYLTAYGVEPLHDHGIDGRRQSVVLVEFAPAKTAGAAAATHSNLRDDLAAFDGLFGLPVARVQVVTRFAGASDPYLAGGEEAMDAEMVHAVAPAANLTAVLQIDAQHHVTVIASSGDDGVAGISCAADPTPKLVKAVNLPAPDPLVLAVGGTTPDANPAPGADIRETAWSSPAVVLPANAPKVPASAQAELLPKGSNGGFSSLFTRPSYQDGIAAIEQTRGVSDVSADAGSHTGMAIALHLTPEDRDMTRNDAEG